jgi:hypothetical protein
MLGAGWVSGSSCVLKAVASHMPHFLRGSVPQRHLHVGGSAWLVTVGRGVGAAHVLLRLTCPDELLALGCAGAGLADISPLQCSVCTGAIWRLVSGRSATCSGWKRGGQLEHTCQVLWLDVKPWRSFGHASREWAATTSVSVHLAAALDCSSSCLCQPLG